MQFNSVVYTDPTDKRIFTSNISRALIRNTHEVSMCFSREQPLVNFKFEKLKDDVKT